MAATQIGKKQEGFALLEKSIAESQEADQFSAVFSAISIIGGAGVYGGSRAVEAKVC